ncbi:polysaccharide deacetylase family protein [Heliophilum fasciatum]|uniref:Polysaccharide deacetylase n=1 Tax=Heliophilum fasciatum TaxID=35700 RepID=A0A4R2RMW4_9FIRM|nr:polysaccharide deacetylase family protein [Heliophilum fasciatum]MCW2278006.1 biofilm PGA synthesis lipoprotein PgaB [Heliophilum fasciatum]TCP64374.1 polysaccharide deacetylase [Heliophilum fasciatum]
MKITFQRVAIVLSLLLSLTLTGCTPGNNSTNSTANQGESLAKRAGQGSSAATMPGSGVDGASEQAQRGANAGMPAKADGTSRDTAGAEEAVDRGPVTILMYHHVTKRGFFANNDAVVTVDDFAKQMAYLKENNYHVVPLRLVADYYAQGASTSLPSKAVAITFDDGYESNYALAYPILKEYGYPFTVFVVANWIAEESAGPFRPERQELLSWPQILEMVQSGLGDIQSHSFDSHYRFNDGGYALAHAQTNPATGEKESTEALTARIYRDLAQSKELLERRTGIPGYALAYPWGKHSDATKQAATQAGYLLAVTMTEGANGARADRLALKRTGVFMSDGFDGFVHKLKAERAAVQP